MAALTAGHRETENREYGTQVPRLKMFSTYQHKYQQQRNNYSSFSPLQVDIKQLKKEKERNAHKPYSGYKKCKNAKKNNQKG